jgi:hypothetical protein
MISAMGSRGVAVLASIAAVLAIVVAVALVFLFSDAPSPAAEPSTPPPASTPETTPTVAPVLEPTVPFGGDCSRVLTSSQLDALLGEGWKTRAEMDAAWGARTYPDITNIMFGTLGGLECTWYAGDSAAAGVWSLSVLLLPEEQAPPAFAAEYAQARCDPSYDANGCRVGRSADGVWAMAGVYISNAEAPAVMLDDAVAYALSNARDGFDGVAAERQEDWFTLPDCESFAQAIRLEEVLGTGYVNGYYEGVEQPEQALLTSAGVGLTCPWFSVDGSAPNGGSFIISATIGAGSSWSWERIAATDGALPVTVAGAVDAVTFDVNDGRLWLYATDGTNVIQLTNAAAEDLIPIAERMLETLAG